MTNERNQTREQRFERWLVWLVGQLDERGLECRLVFEDRHRGDLLVLRAGSAQGYTELKLRRRKRGAVLILVSESTAAAGHFAEAMVGPEPGPGKRTDSLYRRVPRRANAKRKFVHRIERMAQHLASSFATRHCRFPQTQLERLRTMVPTAKAMTGIEALFRSRQHEADAVPLGRDQEVTELTRKSRRQAKRYPSRFAARVPDDGGFRAAMFTGGNFNVGTTPLAVEEGAKRSEGRDSDGKMELGEALDAAELGYEAVELAADVASSATEAGDCGGLDLPDCGCVDVPDCGGCDCAF